LPAGARYERRTFSNAHGTRDYTVYVPARVVGSHMPLVLMLHGCTQDADDFAIGTGMNECAEHRGFVVAYPEQPSSANPSRCWNWFRPGDQARDAGEPAILAGLADALVAEFDLDRGRLFAAGLSAGGAMAAILGEVYPDRFAAVGVHSGLPFGAAVDVPSALAAMAGNARVERPPLANASRARVIVVHGDADRTVDPSNGDAIIRQVTRGEDLVVASSDGNAAGTAFRRMTYATLDNASRAEHWLIRGLAHAWSGGNAEGSYTHPHGPDASEAMLDFFLR
jgi:poly(hydroxyalkanoate) depolymerase family esterase